MSQKNIPTKEDFARAKAAMKKNDYGLSAVREQIKSLFNDNGVHEVFVLYSPTANCFGVYVFFHFNQQIEEAEESGLTEHIKSTVIDELERVGRGSRGSLNVRFEFDSHENVEINFEGNYYNRLH